MRLTHIHAKNFIGLAEVVLPITSPVCLIAGPNAAGKSSLRDAIALALTGDMARVRLKKEAGALVRDGAKKAEIKVTDADGDERRVTITAAGAITDNRPKGTAPDPMLNYVLDAQRFASLDAAARREFLFGLMAVKLDREAVGAKLRGRGHDEKRIANVLPMLRSGFPAAHDEAKAHAGNARAAWKAVTGEAYGTTKAETWEAEAPPAFSEAGLADAIASVQTIEQDIAGQQQAIGTIEAEARARAAAQQKLLNLQPAIDMTQRRREKLAADERGLKAAEDALHAAEAKAGNAPRVGLEHDLAEALAWAATFVPEGLHDNAEYRDGLAALEAYEAQHGKLGAQAGDPAARQALPALRDAARLMASAVQHSSRDLRASEEAEAQAKALREQLAVAFDADALARGRTALADLRGRLTTARAEEARRRALKTAAADADKKTKDAAEHHADAQAWDAIAEALSPNGIPAEMLAKALGPINERLAQSAADTTWPAVTIDGEMAVTLGGRPYGLCSESERWRADAMLAEAIANLSGCGLLVLDRADVLDPASRGDLLAWMGVLADNNEIGTALLFATLKGMPSALPDGIEAHWIEGGSVVAQMAEAA